MAWLGDGVRCEDAAADGGRLLLAAGLWQRRLDVGQRHGHRRKRAWIPDDRKRRRGNLQLAARHQDRLRRLGAAAEPCKRRPCRLRCLHAAGSRQPGQQRSRPGFRRRADPARPARPAYPRDGDGGQGRNDLPGGPRFARRIYGGHRQHRPGDYRTAHRRVGYAHLLERDCLYLVQQPRPARLYAHEWPALDHLYRDRSHFDLSCAHAERLFQWSAERDPLGHSRRPVRLERRCRPVCV